MSFDDLWYCDKGNGMALWQFWRPLYNHLSPKNYWIVQLDFKFLLQEIGTDWFGLVLLHDRVHIKISFLLLQYSSLWWRLLWLFYMLANLLASSSSTGSPSWLFSLPLACFSTPKSAGSNLTLSNPPVALTSSTSSVSLPACCQPTALAGRSSGLSRLSLSQCSS